LSDAFHIAESTEAISHFDQLQDWFESEWDKVDSIDDDCNGILQPIVALTSDDVLAGGLALSRAPSPIDSHPAVWVNAVLVAPAYRRQGLASRLIQTAERAAKDAQVSCLFALTELPGLYAKLGWSAASSQGGDYVMMKGIECDA